ncbi:heme-binding protein 2 [Plakobranchus ocellatus]|uniref:Heme-binding protein 2 n=1 Tax=Plakobranchus ocellatus TaxID=259542 RepID=A0AAV4BUZ8_9GAST|nr:heme-binding protein 2 [Plakobranchus ocellatus]
MFGLLKTFVKGLQTPEFVVVDSTKDYEERKYPAGKWVSTTEKNMSHKDATSAAFRRLFKYIQGENQEKQNVEMTAPVTTKVIPGEGPNCESTFTMSFYIPSEHQEKPPKPINPAVFVEERPEQTVFVSTFGGFGDDEKWIKQGQELSKAIGDESKYVTDFYYTVGYDAPFKLVGRRNEVWFVKKD